MILYSVLTTLQVVLTTCADVFHPVIINIYHSCDTTSCLICNKCFIHNQICCVPNSGSTLSLDPFGQHSQLLALKNCKRLTNCRGTETFSTSNFVGAQGNGKINGMNGLRGQTQ